MKVLKRVVKKYQGFEFVFTETRNGNYKVTVRGFCSYWFQSSTSVREAKRKFLLDD